MGKFGRRARRQRHSAFRGDAGVQLIELAVTLPILMVMVVGIFDFGSAFNVKQKLTNTVREGARFGAGLPTGDLASGGTPNSVVSIKNMVDDYLVAEELNDCNLLRQGAAPAGGLSWTFTTASGSNGCPGPLTLTIDRSYSFPATVGSATINVISTHVTISYPYSWQFGNVYRLLAPGATYANGTTQISIDAIVPNED